MPLPENDSERLDRVIYYLEKMDKRDRARAWGSFLKVLIVWGVVIGSTWYALKYGPALIDQMTKKVLNQAAEQSQVEAQKLMEQLQGKRK